MEADVLPPDEVGYEHANDRGDVDAEAEVAWCAAAVCWDLALAVKDASLGFDDAFYATELEQVVLAQGVTTLDAYRSARRAGRGVVPKRRTWTQRASWRSRRQRAIS